jgi:hypothetical protein
MDVRQVYQSKDKIQSKDLTLTEGELLSIVYHNIFDYPLTVFELIKWKAKGDLLRKRNQDLNDIDVVFRENYFFLKRKKGLVLKRLVRQRISKKKLRMAQKGAKILGLIPTVKMIAVTGALSMGNADEESDIDLMLITQKGTLWTTRLLSLLILAILRIPTRRYGDKNQKDKLCLNLWLDESDMGWRKRNIFTAHEIAQIRPLVNKDQTYEKFIYKNRWIKDFWPNAVKIKKPKPLSTSDSRPLPPVLETVSQRLQFWYMKKKITRETISSTRAIFHPHDWSKVVLSRL